MKARPSIDVERAIEADIVQTLIDCLEYFSGREDADCEGDPLEFVPNEEMRLAAACRDALEKAERIGL